MWRVKLGATGIEASCLGFGGAGLGSRIDAAGGARALAEAFDGGVTWFDLAPVYGAGQAEAIAAPFLRTHRAEVQIATKAGLALGRAYRGGPGARRLRQLLMPAARRAIASVGPLRRSLRRAGLNANTKLPLTPELLTASLEASLRRLGTDRVELFALHAPTAEEVAREDIRRALEDILAAGKARAISVAADAPAAAAALAVGPPYGAIQSAPPPGRPTCWRRRRARTASGGSRTRCSASAEPGMSFAAVSPPIRRWPGGWPARVRRRGGTGIGVAPARTCS